MTIELGLTYLEDTDDLTTLPTHPPVGYLNAHEVSLIQTACHAKHNQNESLSKKIISLAKVVATLVTYLIGASLMPALVVYITSEYIGTRLYQVFRNQDYTDTADALSEPGFNRFIVKNNFDVSSANICEIHTIYKGHLQNRIDSLKLQPNPRFPLEPCLMSKPNPQTLPIPGK